MKKLIFILFILTFSLASFAQKGKYKKAQKTNTVESYQDFLNKYPDSEFSDDAKSNLLKLEYEKAKQSNSIVVYKEFVAKRPDNEFTDEATNWINLKKQSLINSINKIKNYTTGLTTKSQFISDGWNAKDPWLGNIGIVEMKKTPQRTEYILGICDSNNPSKAEEMNSMFNLSNFVANSNYKATVLSKREVKLDSEGRTYIVGGENVTGYIAALIFENDILVSKELY